MQKIRVIFSLIAILVGILIISVTKMLVEFAVVLGRAAYQAAAAGSYSPDWYRMNLSLNYWLGALCILFGIFFLIGGERFIRGQIEEMRRANRDFDLANQLERREDGDK